MSLICLILSGGTLLINGLGLLGRIPARDSGYFTVLIGSTQLVLSTLIAVAANGDTHRKKWSRLLEPWPGRTGPHSP